MIGTVDTVVMATTISYFLGRAFERLSPGPRSGWPEAIPSHWPQEWRDKFAKYKPGPSRRRDRWIELKEIIEDTDPEANRAKIWRSSDGVRMRFDEMGDTHLRNAIAFCHRKRSWDFWISLIVEYRRRLRDDPRISSSSDQGTIGSSDRRSGKPWQVGMTLEWNWQYSYCKATIIGIDRDNQTVTLQGYGKVFKMTFRDLRIRKAKEERGEGA